MSTPFQFQSPYTNARFFHSYTGITVPFLIRAPGFQQLFQVVISYTQQPGSSSFSITLARSLLKNLQYLLSHYNIHSQHFCITFPQARLSHKKAPPCLSRCIPETLKYVLTIPTKPMPLGPTITPNTAYLRPPYLCSTHSHHLVFSFILSLCDSIPTIL